MAKLTFKNDRKHTLSKMVEFATTHDRKRPYSNEDTTDLGLWMVKDEGIYLMSPTKENFCLGDALNSVVYASGYKPTKANHDTLWDKTYAVSHDDFAEFVPLMVDQVDRIIKGGSITIDITEDHLAVRA